MIEDAGAMAAMSRRDARRRTRIAVAVYAVGLVALLAIGAYLAPSGTIGDDGDAPTSSEAR